VALESLLERPTAAVILEPLVQGANQIRVWPAGLLAQVRAAMADVADFVQVNG
jgi:adenosylmethionine-8-amino-7-oxononanoate aminotransferase